MVWCLYWISVSNWIEALISTNLRSLTHLSFKTKDNQMAKPMIFSLRISPAYARLLILQKGTLIKPLKNKNAKLKYWRIIFLNQEKLNYSKLLLDSMLFCSKFNSFAHYFITNLLWAMLIRPISPWSQLLTQIKF